MIRFAALGMAAVLAGGCGGASPATSPGTMATPRSTRSPVPADATALPTLALATFTSPLHGFSFAHPVSWLPRAAREPWRFGDYVEPDEPYVDSVRPASGALGGLAGIAAQPLPDGMTPEAWFEDWARRRDAEGVACRFEPAAWTYAMVAGAPARRIEAPCSIETGAPFDGPILEAAWVIDDVVYVATGTPVIVEIILESFRPS